MTKLNNKNVKLKLIFVLLVILIISLITLFSIVKPKEYKVYTELSFDEPIKHTLAVVVDNRKNRPIFDNEDNIIKYSDFKNYIKENEAEYLKYHKENEDLLESEVVWIVNMGLHYEDYSNIVEIDNPDYYHAIVNRNRKVKDDFKPDDLVEHENGVLMRFAVRENLLKMLNALDKEDLLIEVIKGYSSEDNDYRLGHSEHQLGLAIDISDVKTDDFSKSESYLFLKDNAHLFGFIFRYDNNKIIDTDKEVNHLRYVGKDIAIDMYEKNISVLEEYLDKHK